jgi:hypothetical protein
MGKVRTFVVVAQYLAALRLTELYYNKWISEDVIVELCNQYCTTNLTRRSLRRAYGNPALHCVSMLKTTNSYGVYRRDSRNCRKQIIYYYYFTKSDAAVPHSTTDWESTSITSIHQLKRRHTSRLDYIKPGRMYFQTIQSFFKILV